MKEEGTGTAGQRRCPGSAPAGSRCPGTAEARRGDPWHRLQRLRSALEAACCAIPRANRPSGGMVAGNGLPASSEEMAILTCPNCGIGVQPEDLICFRCGANLPHAPYPDDDIPSPTVSQQYIRPSDGQPLPGTRRRPSMVVLRIAFPTGNVDVPAGTSVILGRDPAQSLVAAAFGDYDNVSRKHATVVVDDGGRAIIRDEGSTNGTFVNGDRVMAYTEVRLVDGDQIRLAADVTGDVSLPRGETDPASLSRNGFV
jgi:pSer/pThr/pTyr-binding forkhead associated (FHA) protein